MAVTDDFRQIGGADGHSARIHSTKHHRRGKLSRQACARSRPLATPSREHSACSRMAMTLLSSATNSSA